MTPERIRAIERLAALGAILTRSDAYANPILSIHLPSGASGGLIPVTAARRAAGHDADAAAWLRLWAHDLTVRALLRWAEANEP